MNTKLLNFLFWFLPIPKTLTLLRICILYIKTLSLYFYISIRSKQPPSLERAFCKSRLFSETRKVKVRKSSNPNLERLLCISNLFSEPKISEVRKCNKSCFCSEYIVGEWEFKLKKVIETFFLKLNFKCESSNLICVLICWFSS